MPPIATATFQLRVTQQGIAAPTFQFGIEPAGTYWANEPILGVTGRPGISTAGAEYTTIHLHTVTGTAIELMDTQHQRDPGERVGGRYTSFTSTGQPVRAFYWPSGDTLQQDTDNYPGFYLPWRQWLYVRSLKIWDISTTPATPIYRIRDGTAVSVPNNNIKCQAYVEPFPVAPATAAQDWENGTWNPACLVNPTGNYSICFGGGWGDRNNDTTPLLQVPRWTIIEDHPNPVGIKTLRARIYRTGSGVQPAQIKNVSKVGDWVYWGHCARRGTAFGSLGWQQFQWPHECYRAKLSDMLNGVWTVQRITDFPTRMQPTTASSPVDQNGNATDPNDIRYRHRYKWPSWCADEARNRIIVPDDEGVFVYQIPQNDGPNGQWFGPFRGGLTEDQWFAQITQNYNWWHGMMAVHRADLNQTFFRVAYCGNATNIPRWNRIIWNN